MGSHDHNHGKCGSCGSKGKCGHRCDKGCGNKCGHRCDKGCGGCGPSEHDDSSRCCVRRQEYFLDACPNNRRKHHKRAGEQPDSVKLFVQDFGSEHDPVIVIPDGILAPQQFEYQINPLVDAGFRVIIVTPRGFGQSDKPYGPYNLDVWADDLHSVIEQLCVEDVTLVGSTPLSMISTRYLSRHGCCKVSRAFFHAPNANPSLFFNPAPWLTNIQADRETTIDSFTTLLYSPVDPTDAQRAWANALQNQVPIRVWTAFFNTFTQNLTSELAKVCAPVVGILGAGDQLSSVALSTAFIAGVPNGKLIVVEDQGHLIQITDASVYNAALIALAKATDPDEYVRNLVV